MSKGAEQAIDLIDSFYDKLAVTIDNDATRKVVLLTSEMHTLLPDTYLDPQIGEAARFEAEKSKRAYSAELGKIVALLRNL